jgi:hypothetical protein
LVQLLVPLQFLAQSLIFKCRALDHQVMVVQGKDKVAEVVEVVVSQI